MAGEGIMKPRYVLLLLALLVGIVPALAQEPAKPPEQGTDQQPRGRGRGAESTPQGLGVLRLLPADSVTEHTIDTPAGKLAYTATAGTLPLFDTSGEHKASVFYVAYRAHNTDAAARPVTFVFNGGPGAASAYLHLGLVGPRRLDFGPSGRDGANAQMRDNPETWLAFTDLVMIDPIGTGWSRTAKPDDAAAYYGVRADAQVMAKIIALYVARNGRSASPKYLLGESYGGFRAAKVARTLQEEQGLVVSGILMVSPLIEGGLHFGSADRFALGCALQLPSIAASESEWRKSFSADEQQKAERFAMTEFLTTLAGPPPKGDAARAFHERVAALTGLPLNVVAKSTGCLRDEYLKSRREGEVLSIYDATFASPDPFPESRRRGSDAVLDGFTRALGAAFVGYARDELGFKTDITYSLLGGEANGKWDWPGGRNGASVTDDLRELLALNTSFRLFITHGYSDLVIPYAVSKYVVEHLPQSDEPDRVVLKLYRGGHMFYFREDSRLASYADAKAFYGVKR
jgi:carboxypeptidase C (cathepsin A)